MDCLRSQMVANVTAEQGASRLTLENNYVLKKYIDRDWNWFCYIAT